MLGILARLSYPHLAAREDGSKHIISFRYVGQSSLVECLGFLVVTPCILSLAKAAYNSVLASILTMSRYQAVIANNFPPRDSDDAAS